MRTVLKFNRDQLFKLSDIFSDAGLVALATVAIPAVLDRVDQNRLILGLIITILCWLVSLFLRR